MTKEELKRREREDAERKKLEEAEQIEKDKIEKEEVKKETEAFQKRLNSIIGKFKEAAQYNLIIDTFRMLDDKNSGKLSIKLFTKGMLE